MWLQGQERAVCLSKHQRERCDLAFLPLTGVRRPEKRVESAEKVWREVFVVQGRSFRTWKLHIDYSFTDVNWQRHSVRKVLASFCTMGHINEPRYPAGCD